MSVLSFSIVYSIEAAYAALNVHRRFLHESALYFAFLNLAL